MARQPRTSGASNSSSWGRRGGRAALAQAQQERSQAAARRNQGPWRFFLEKNSSREIVILDATLDDMWSMYEHTYYNASDKPPVQQFTCCKEIEDCPICEAALGANSPYAPSNYTMYFSVIEQNSDPAKPLYYDKEDKPVFHQKRLLAVKSSASVELERALEVAEKGNNGALRGVVLRMERDGGQQSVRIGKPAPMDNGMVYALYDEDTLVANYGHAAVVRDGNTVKKANEDITPYDYGKIFPKPSAKGLAEATGLPVPAGSQADIEDDLREDEEQGVQEEAPESSATRTGTANRRRAPSAATGGSAPTRGRARPSSASASASEENDAPPPKRAARSKPAAAIVDDEIPF